jgi:hypothetical protein
MKLYVLNKINQKVYLNLTAATRQGLANQIGGRNFYLGDSLYSVNQVWAENDSNSTATGAVVGGVVGALGGPVGILIGGLLGGLFGNGSEEQETAQVKRFNQSQ